MVRKGALAAGLLFFAGAAYAGTPLWGGIEAGMPFRDARAIYPNAHVHTGKGLASPQIFIAKHDIDGCEASVSIYIDRKVEEPDAQVQSVELSGEGCDAKIYGQLLARYGEPTSLNDDNRKQKKRRAVWIADGKTISFKVDYGWPDYWQLTYEPVKDLGL